MEKNLSLTTSPLCALRKIVKEEEFGSVIDGMNVMAMKTTVMKTTTRKRGLFNHNWVSGLYRGTSDKGPSEKRTASLERTVYVPKINYHFP